MYISWYQGMPKYINNTVNNGDFSVFSYDYQGKVIPKYTSLVETIYISAICASLSNVNNNINTTAELESTVLSNTSILDTLQSIISLVGEVNTQTQAANDLSVLNAMLSVGVESNSSSNNIINVLFNLISNCNSSSNTDNDLLISPVSIDMTSISNSDIKNIILSQIVELASSINSESSITNVLDVAAYISANVESVSNITLDLSTINSLKPIVLLNGELTVASDDNYINAGGISMIITLAKLTEGGSTGSIEFLNGVLVSATMPT